jgi:CheY-like chemotaxis protein
VRADEPKDDKRDPEVLEGRRVLIVDDNATTRRILVLQTRLWKMVPASVSSGVEALRIAGKQAPFDIAILDLCMPGMNGSELAIKLNALYPAMSIVMLTSIGTRCSTLPELLHASISKPVKRVHLLNALASAFPDQPVVHPVATATIFQRERADEDTPRVLVAEDNATNQKIVVMMLNSLGFEADVVANGLEALDAIQRVKYKIILMDLRMPEMNGLEAARHILTREGGTDQPYIIAVTADVTADQCEAAKEAGMQDFISKPIERGELEKTLDRALTTLAGTNDYESVSACGV